MAMEKLLSCDSGPTAVLVSNDLMAVGALQAAHAANVRVPRELSIVGFDDLPIASMVHPPLSTICLSRSDLAARAFGYLHQALQGGKVVADASVQPHLVVRGSTAPPSARKRR